VRQLAVDLRINANTVAKVYRDLEKAGLLETRRGVGTFVMPAASEAMPRRERERILKRLADRILAEVSREGFSADELVTHIRGRLTKGG
jgi:GntR family transcriptional regulator